MFEDMDKKISGWINAGTEKAKGINIIFLKMVSETCITPYSFLQIMKIKSKIYLQ